MLLFACFFFFYYEIGKKDLSTVCVQHNFAGNIISHIQKVDFILYMNEWETIETGCGRDQ